MKKNNLLYHSLDKAILRTPLLPFTRYGAAKDYRAGLFQEAIYVASPDFYDLMQSTSNEKIKQTLYKYYSRACSRCTPFGLFATCSVVEIGEATNIVVPPIEKTVRHARLDIACIGRIIRYLENKTSLKNKLIYYPNESLYPVYDSLRYYEAAESALTGATYSIASVLKTDYLEQILQAARQGKTIGQLADLLVSEDISFEEAREYIEELIGNQLLISNLFLPENSVFWFDHLADRLREMEETEPFIEEIRTSLTQINNGKKGIDGYRQICATFESEGLTFPASSIFHVDTYRPCLSATLSKQTVDDLLAGITFLCKITRRNPHYLLDNFRIKFSQRYDRQEVPLLTALDTDLGIDYLNQQASPEETGLLGDLIFPQIPEDPIGRITPLKKILLKKYVEAIKNNSAEIILSEADLPEPTASDTPAFPATMAVLGSLYKKGTSDTYVLIKSAGSSTAAAVVSRFAHLHPSFQDNLESISQLETSYYEDCLVAEIAYMPNEKTGNIVVKPSFRAYEIPLFNKAGVDKQHQISISDLTVRLEDDQFIIRSKGLNKRIIPFLSSAYNYQNCKLPLIRFLCDLQFQQIETPYLVEWGEEYAELDYFPRIIFKRCILARQKWRIRQKELAALGLTEETCSPAQLQAWRAERHLPPKVIYPEYDHELLVDFENVTSIRIFLGLLKAKGEIMLEEFLFSEEEALVSDQEEGYCNEFIFLVKKA